MRFVPVPGSRRAWRRHSDSCIPTYNLAAYLDRKLMLGHLWEKTRDPEGILSTIAGDRDRTLWRSDRRMAASRSAHRNRKLTECSCLGSPASLPANIWNLWFPINKKLWTSSYVVFTAGSRADLPGACYWVSDIKLHRGRWTTPFLILGNNAITAYVMSQLIGGWLGWRGLCSFHRVALVAGAGFSAAFLRGLRLGFRACLVDVPQEDLP